MDPPQDVLLSRVTENLTNFVGYLEACLPGQQLPPLLEEVLRLHWRSKEMLVEFSGYFCVRLLLDEDSPLASQFVDFFSELNWLMASFEKEVKRLPLAQNATEEVIELGKILLESFQPVVSTCLFHYCLHQAFLSFRNDYSEFKRKAKPYRMFWKHVFHCVTRDLGFVNLDACGENRVELDEILGTGSFGTVYKGHFTRGKSRGELNNDDPIGDPVAVKMFPGFGNMSKSSVACSGAGSTTAPCMAQMKGPNSSNTLHIEQLRFCVQSFQTILIGSSGNSVCWDRITPDLSDELLKLASLRHPNVVVVKGYITRREEKSGRTVIGECGIVMELMDKSLCDFLQSNDMELEELEIIDLMLEIAKGMRFLHECNLMHRDLKPGNVLLRRRRPADAGVKLGCVEVKLADLGLAKRMIGEAPCLDSMHTACAGTTYYMAPEVRFTGEMESTKYTDKADVFSYGTTCFNILTGDPDVRRSTGSSTQEFYEMIDRGVWKKWVNSRPGHLIDVIACCWQTDASKRPTFAEICLALQYEKRCVLASKCVRPLPEIMEIASPPLMGRSALRKADQEFLSNKKKILWLAEALKTGVRSLGTNYARRIIAVHPRDIDQREKAFRRVSGDLYDLLGSEKYRLRIAGALAEAVHQRLESVRTAVGTKRNQWQMLNELHQFLRRAVHYCRFKRDFDPQTKIDETAGMDHRLAKTSWLGGSFTSEVALTLESWSKDWARLKQQWEKEGRSPYAFRRLCSDSSRVKVQPLICWGRLCWGRHWSCVAMKFRGDEHDFDLAAELVNRRVFRNWGILRSWCCWRRCWDIHDVRCALLRHCAPARTRDTFELQGKSLRRIAETVEAIFMRLVVKYCASLLSSSFNFRSDDAQTTLDLDESIIPLLLSFHIT